MAKTRALDRLYERAPIGMRFGLEPMKEVCARLGHPEDFAEIVHVAGTNGKGSVCAMVESIARVSGRKTGLYTSPHLCRFAERIRLEGLDITDEALEDALSLALDAGPDLSFFEAATLTAFVAMRAAKIDFAVVEVGLGGRLDATNVMAHPSVTAITSIAMDHMGLLGDSLASIAREKAGIAKRGVDLVIGEMDEIARLTIEETAREVGANVCRIEENDDSQIVIHTPIGLAGKHQIKNARVAFAIGRKMGASTDACLEGIGIVNWPGRLESITATDGPVLIDAAHNPEGARALCAHLTTLGIPMALLFGTLADKAWPEMIDVLAPSFTSRTYVAPKGRAATSPVSIASRHSGQVADSVMEGYQLARRAVGEKGLVVACGSIFLIGELRAALLGLARDLPIAL